MNTVPSISEPNFNRVREFAGCLNIINEVSYAMTGKGATVTFFDGRVCVECPVEIKREEFTQEVTNYLLARGWTMGFRIPKDGSRPDDGIRFYFNG